MDAVIRHELGHVLDFFVFGQDLEDWARARGVDLPYTAERRADAIALALWGDVILYDDELVQSLTQGVTPRPTILGL